MPDVEHYQRFVIDIPTFGDPERERTKLLVTLGRAMHHMIKPGCVFGEIRRLDTGAEGLTVVKWFRYEAKGDDMGNHEPEHTVPLVEVEHE